MTTTANTAPTVEHGTTVFIPLNKLKKHPRNARKTPHSEASIETKAASIAAKGILQNLVVEPETNAEGEPTGFYLVSIGEGRRLAQMLRVKRKQIKKTEPIRCVIDTANDAAEISLDENVTREDILAIQLFVTLIEFKLATLAGFVLIPFGLFGKTAFMAEKVLGNIISSGIKVLVLAVIIGIGSTLFSEFTKGFGGQTPSIDDAMAVVLAALSLVALGIFGPGIANGLVSGGPQLGAGAAVGGGAMMAAKGGAAMLSGGAAAARGGATAAGAASSAYSLGSLGKSGASGVASGMGAVTRTAGSAAVSPLRRAASRAADSMKSSFSDGAKAGFGATGGSSTMGTIGGEAAEAASTPTATGGAPDWAKRMKRNQHLSQGVSAAAHAIRSGDSHGSGSSINLSESDR